MKRNDNKSIEKMDMSEKMEMSEKILDRIIGFINSCDSKASIVLALIGVLLTVICIEVPNHVIAAKDVDSFQLNCLFVIYIICVVLCFISLAVSIAFLISVLYGRISGLKKSNIFFGDISIIRMEEYKKRIDKMNNQGYEDDLIEQVYINSQICTRKYKRYNTSLIFLVIGLFLFMVAILFEIFVL